MSSPLNRRPTSILPEDTLDGIDVGTVDDLENWVEGLLREEREERKFRPTLIDVRTSPEQLEKKRLELFRLGSKFAPVYREDVVGVDNILSQIDEVIDWLIHYKDYAKFGARLEPGVLFEGSPGTGKTHTSRYMATATDALFIDVRDFPYSGKVLTALDIKDLFILARETHLKINKPVILFWDEFEVVAVLLVGCTNYGGEIDVALRRSGRMGIHVEFNAPNRIGKAKLLQLYISKIRTKGEIDFDTASYFFDDSDTAASVEEAVQEAWRFAIYRWIREGHPRKGPALTQPDLLEVFLKRLVGPPPAYSEVSEETMYRIAVHETGHALAATLLDVGLRLVTVRPGAAHLGKTMTYLKDPRTATLPELLAHLKVGVAGFVVEDITGIPRGADASGDTRSITEIALDMVDNQGFSDRVGLFNPHAVAKRNYVAHPSVSEKIIEDSDLDVQDLINQAEKDTRKLLVDFGVDKIKKLAEKLVEVQTMTGKEFEGEVERVRH